MRIAIIGTAGRREDACKLGGHSFLQMVDVATRVASKLANGRAWRAVSGGAAWADHLAVTLFLNGTASGLDLELPAPLSPSGFADTGVRDFRQNPGGTSNHYHRIFARVAGVDSIAELNTAASRPGCKVSVSAGFFARNSLVADVDACIALTFGERALLKDGGTADTMRKFLARGAGPSVHVDLHDFSAYSPARVE
jgi:hypothetical protein